MLPLNNRITVLFIMKKLLIFVLAFSFLLASSLTLTSCDANRTLKILTYNVIGCVDYSGYGLEGWNPWTAPSSVDKVAKIVKDSKAQVIGFNEIYGRGYDENDKQVERIAEKVGYNYQYFAKASLGISAYPIGNGMVSKFEIIESETTLVPATTLSEIPEGDLKDSEDRSLLRAVIDFNGTAVSVYVTHLGLDSKAKSRMINTILEKIEGETNPYIVMGDFNLEPNEELLTPLFNKMQSTAKVMNNTHKTWSTYGGEARIDYIFVSNHFTVKKYKVIDVNVSDHYPCYAEVVLNN